jgi:hypothetical protein
MATKGTGTKKKAELPAAELQAANAVAAFKKKYEGKDLTEAQKKEYADLRDTLGKLKFVRIANKRVPKALAAVKGIANLAGAGYVKNAAQVKAICDALDQAAKDVRGKLSGEKQSAAGFVLPIETEQK